MARPRPLGLEPDPLPRGFPGRVEFLKSARRLSQAPHLPQPEVCFCGRSNVGKSTLLNKLANRKQLARVSSTPGRTRLINFFDAQGRVTLVDLPGYGWARVTRGMQEEWGRTIREYLEDRPQLCLALLLVDLRRDPGDEERQLLDWFAQQGRMCLIVATKADKVRASRRTGRVRSMARSLGVPARDVVSFSALTGEGRDVLWGTILAAAREASGGDG
ncbi:MAG: ribosome biogenesis GTP-binding protein YihA/YsxC [Myxococcota bacterium]